MANITIPKEYKYLGEVPQFKKNGLPVGYLIDKGKVGCGGTSIALENEKDTIVCVPFVSLIKNKMEKYNKAGLNVLGVYEGITKQDIQSYINGKNGAKKIICTYDSLSKVIDVIGYSYFLLIDELHLLFIEYVFRNKAVRTVLNEYSKFKEWSFLTATPIEYDLMLEELKEIPTYKIEWELKADVKVNAIQCKQVGATVKKIVNEFLDGKVFGNVHLFVNSVEFIATIIKACNLTNENTRVIFSKNNATYKNTCQGVTNSETTSPVKKINFYTSTCFEGCDLFDRDGKIYIVSESSRAQTLLDISTQVRQIAGRIRDTQYFDSITHLYKATRYNKNLTFDEYKQVVLEEERKAKSYVAKLNNDLELIEGTKESVYPYLEKVEEENKPAKFIFDPNRMKLDIYNFKVLNHTYSLQVNLSDEYNKAGLAIDCDKDKTSDKLLKNESTRTTFKEAIQEYDTIIQRKANMTFCLSDNERLALLKKKYRYISDAYELLGMEQIRELNYHTSHIQRLLIAISDKMDNKAKVAKLLLTIPAFKEGEFIPSTKIKECLQTIYNNLEIKRKATIDDFKYFAVIEDSRKRIDGKQVRGYIIKYIKIK
ncbi:hypothetical protein K0F31_12905 [Bacteroides thetaiotaomicron]|jgi:hypothetical protein|uniref:hypothetical protein n=1 Tax=Bacteroides TaxID=816 RepID=UPI00189E2072|nr:MULTISPECIES: hypothetical protein [Bacteroides]MCE8814123.1 hypothetical protein [Bacteroides thetaiotaomicron]